MRTPHKTKSRTFRRIRVTTPGGTSKVVFKRRKPSKAVCPCGEFLKGVARDIPSKMKNMPKSQKRPSRPFGGVLCSRCLRKKIAEDYKDV